VILRDLADAPQAVGKRNLGVHQFQGLVIANRSQLQVFVNALRFGILRAHFVH
jgi:hypothetical protein